MAIPKLLHYYRFTPLPDPTAIRLWQRDLCQRLSLKGRIVISRHGINGAIGGEVSAVKQYVKTTREYLPFADINFTWSSASGQEFPRLSVKVRDELVTFGAAEELNVSTDGVQDGGRHLDPQQLHDLVESRAGEVTFFDGRNKFEAAIGRFRGAVVPDVDTTKDFVAELDSGKYDHLKDRPVVTYCTGGIRCEVLSSMMRRRGFSEVYQLSGGIVRYGEAYGDSGLWEGSLYVFDDRTKIDFSDSPAVIGSCESCGAPTSQYRDCVANECKGRALLCGGCADSALCGRHS
jgi:UPF0176 protein